MQYDRREEDPGSGIRVLIAEDQPLIREGIASLLRIQDGIHQAAFYARDHHLI